MSPRRVTAGCAAVLAVAVLAGCGGPSVPPAPAPAPSAAAATGPNGLVIPPRTQTLRLEGVSMCSLITEAQLPRFGGTDQIPNAGEPMSGALGGPDCIWTGDKPRYGWLGRFIPGSGVEVVLFRAEGVVPVEGFWAVSMRPELFDPRITCYLDVDIAPGQILFAQFQNDARDDPAMTHEKACRQAANLAAAMIKTARAQGR